MQNTKNFYITIALSVLILMFWQIFYMNPKIAEQREQLRIETVRLEEEKTKAAPGAAISPAPAPAGTQAEPATALSVADAIKQTQRVTIDTPSVKGSINLVGARFDDVVFKKFREQVSPTSPNIQLLSPSPVASGYFAEVGFAGEAAVGILPGPDTVWSVAGNANLTATAPVVLTFTNDKGLTFKRTIAIDEKYMFTINDSVTNAGGADVSLAPYGRVTRYQKPAIAGTFVLHEGAIGYSTEGGLQEITFTSLEEDKETKPEKSSDGWIGFTDKYWATALIPTGKSQYQPRYSYFPDGRTRYQVDYLTDPMAVKVGETKVVETLFFAGAKEVGNIEAYGKEKAITRFDLVIDWGWFYFFTKPMFYLMDWLNTLIGNFGLAILATTVIVKLIFFPLASKSYVSMAHMKTAQPKMQEIKEKYADDRTKQQQAMLELYKTEKINPIAGCWPVLLQIPVFFALYKVIYTTIEMRHAPFYGWIHDLSAPDPTSLFNLFGLLPISLPVFLMIGVWPLLMGITMFLQMRMNPTPPDPTQAMIFTYMPIMFTFMMAAFPAGLIIYWAWNNFLSILQQGFIMKRNGAKIELWDNLVGLFKKTPTTT